MIAFTRNYAMISLESDFNLETIKYCFAMKKNLMNRLVILLLLLAAVPVSVHAAVIPPEWEGDVNLDGEVDISDATYLINGLLNEVIVPSMDVNQDGVINITDATCLINMLLNMPSATETYVVNGVSFKMIYVRAGSYEMGATDEQTGATQDEYPPHLVQLTPYYIGETEVSQELWYAVMGDNPSYSKGYNLPVEQITWDECQEFVNRLSMITGRQFRLPTEAEWEFAARGAHKSGGFLYSGSNILSQVGWYDTNSGGKTNLIKQLMGNERQLYDMSGNVWEWCQDWFGDYSDDHQLDPKGPAEGVARVVRGGGWEAPDAFCRVAYRKGQAPGQPDEHIGLRLAMDVYDTYWLSLSSRVVSMEVGESRSVNILNGSGDYTIYNNNAEIVNCTLSGETLNISGLSVGTTTITVVDNLTHCQVDVTAIVYEHVEPSTFVVNGVEFSVNFVQGGNYVMGGTSEQGSDAQGFERPAHYVTLSDYYMGATEVTQALWHAVMGNNPSYFAGVDHLNYPVEQVTWDECQEFVCRLSEITGRTFRMPTEAEWEFAARGGLKSHGYKYAGGDLLDLVAWHSGNAFAVGASSPDYGTHAVATKAPNELGLYDMSGNVMEWCLDLSAAYTTDTQVNPTGPYSGSSVVGRGGGWQSAAANCRVSSRHTLSPANKHLTRGLRVVMEPYRPTTSHFDVYERVIRVQVGTTRLVDILNGSGDYLIYNNRISDYATCSIVGDQIQVTGVSAGTGIIAVKDRQTGAVTWFTVIVKGPFALSKNELTLTVGRTDSVYIINGNGRYLIESDSSIVTPSLISNRLKVKGVAPGTTRVSVTDLSINATVHLNVTVKEPTPAHVEEIVVNDVRFNMITVQGGSFIMGEIDTDASGYFNSSAKPAHIVTLSSYCIGETEVTQELWTSIMGSNPSYNNDNIHKPVERVSWSSCRTFINKLNELTGKHFRLPTEAEWEFAARGGNKSRGYMYSGSDNIDEVAWYSGTTANSYPSGCVVALKASNELGIYDMSGSASEICSDAFDADYYRIEPQINPKGPASGSGFVIRGGNRESSATPCTVWYRSSGSYSSNNINYTGLRLAMDLEEDTIPLPSLSLSENFVTIEVGESKSINILNGGGNYTITNSADILSMNMSGNTLSITGLEIGIIYITLVDNDSGERTFLTVIVSGETFTVNGVPFKMMYVKGDSFTMGASDDDADARSEEKPAHAVTLNSYRLGQTEVTQELWQAVMGNNPSKFTGNLQRPVEQVTWNDCQVFILKLNQLTGQHFRMPTEAEWEFAAKGGIMNHGYKYSGSETIDDVAWYSVNAGSGVGSDSPDYGPHPVATKLSNELGIYDMTGNVSEWCQDWYNSYTSSGQTNPTGPSTYSGGMAIPQRSRRGGNYNCSASLNRNTIRFEAGQKEKSYSFGLRLALDMDNTPKVHFSESVVTVPLGESITVELLNNSDSFTVAGGTDYVTTSVSGNNVTISGIAVGVTSIHTSNNAVLPVIVGYANPPEPTNLEVETFTVNGVSFDMTTVEGGTFRMGNAEYSKQRPVHQVTLTDYKIGNTEVTQALWQAVMGYSPSYFSGNLQRPVEQVSWTECQAFIYKLNQLTGKHFRMPTEAEWEFAARGGNYGHGYPYSGSDVIGDVAWYNENASDVGSDSPDYGPHAVATKLPNELGLYDMSGNVSEWCFDWHTSYSSSAQTDPVGPATGSYRVLRPTSWGATPDLEYGSVTSRSNDYPSRPSKTVGLRLALDVDDNPKMYLSETVVVLKVGETKTIDILNGTGSYSASGGTDYVTTKISNGRLNITGKAIGCTSVCVSSKATIAVIVVSSSTPDDLDSFIMEDWEGCDNVTSGTVYWTENDIQGHTWKWDFSDARIQFDNNWGLDYCHGKLVCRFGETNSSSIAMTEDFTGHTKAFGFFACAAVADADATLRVDYSFDGGQTWSSLGSVTVKRYVFQNYIFGVEVDGNVRFRVVQTAGKRVDIDDIAIYY